ncbi:MAG: hypothetical protein MUF54_10970 [Polyangiaceae bacterium]|jgi:hypothetical protein|nr:hypothetical protein [Polyangiaceae bacterium]
MKEVKRTQFAQVAFDYSTFFAVQFAQTRVAGACPRAPVLVAPEGMSTGGGKLVRQHIALRPEQQDFPALTVGTVDVSRSTATLRTYGYLLQAHRARFGDRPFDIDPSTYQAFFQQAQQFFASQGMRIDLETEQSLPHSLVTPKPRSNLLPIVAAAIGLALLAAVAIAGTVYIRFFG